MVSPMIYLVILPYSTLYLRKDIAKIASLEQNLHMNENEQYVNKHLDEMLKRAIEIESYRNSNLQSTLYRNFYSFDPGDRISMVLSAIAINGIYLEQTQRVEGILVHPEMALIDVKYVDDLEEWEGKTIGLGVCTKLVQKDEMRAFSKVISGNAQVAYYVPDDIVYNRINKPTISDDKLSHLALKYTKVTVGGSKIIDFTS